MFPQNEEEKKESIMQPTDYLNLDPKLYEFILEKEKLGHCFFLKKNQVGKENDVGDYKCVSQWLESVDVLGEENKKYK